MPLLNENDKHIHERMLIDPQLYSLDRPLRDREITQEARIEPSHNLSDPMSDSSHFPNDLSVYDPNLWNLSWLGEEIHSIPDTVEPISMEELNYIIGPPTETMDEFLASLHDGTPPADQKRVLQAMRAAGVVDEQPQLLLEHACNQVHSLAPSQLPQVSSRPVAIPGQEARSWTHDGASALEGIFSSQTPGSMPWRQHVEVSAQDKSFYAQGPRSWSHDQGPSPPQQSSSSRHQNPAISEDFMLVSSPTLLGADYLIGGNTPSSSVDRAKCHRTGYPIGKTIDEKAELRSISASPSLVAYQKSQLPGTSSFSVQPATLQNDQIKTIIDSLKEGFSTPNGTTNSLGSSGPTFAQQKPSTRAASVGALLPSKRELATPRDTNITLLGRLPITVEEFLTFFPNHTLWPSATNRLVQNGWRAKQICAYKNYARDLTGTNAFLANTFWNHIKASDKAIYLCQFPARKGARPVEKVNDLSPGWWMDKPGVTGLPVGPGSIGPRGMKDVKLSQLILGVVNWPKGDGRGPLTKLLEQVAEEKNDDVKLSDIERLVNDMQPFEWPRQPDAQLDLSALYSNAVVLKEEKYCDPTNKKEQAARYRQRKRQREPSAEDEERNVRMKLP